MTTFVPGFSIFTGVTCAVDLSKEAFKCIVLKEEPVNLTDYMKEIVGFQKEVDKYQLELEERKRKLHELLGL